MTPKDKAKELVDKTYDTMLILRDGWNSDECNAVAKECALIAVDEIINNDGFTMFDMYLTEYWQQVKQEIQNL